MDELYEENTFEEEEDKNQWLDDWKSLQQADIKREKRMEEVGYMDELYEADSFFSFNLSLGM